MHIVLCPFCLLFYLSLTFKRKYIYAVRLKYYMEEKHAQENMPIKSHHCLSRCNNLIRGFF